MGPLSRAGSFFNSLSLLSLSLSLSLTVFPFFNWDPKYFSSLWVCVAAYHVYVKQCCFNIYISCIPAISSEEEKLDAEREKTRHIYYKDTKHGHLRSSFTGIMSIYVFNFASTKEKKRLIAQQHIIVLSDWQFFFIVSIFLFFFYYYTRDSFVDLLWIL